MLVLHVYWHGLSCSRLAEYKFNKSWCHTWNHVGVVEYARTCGAFDLKIFRIEVHHEHALVAILKLTYAQVHTLPHT